MTRDLQREIEIANNKNQGQRIIADWMQTINESCPLCVTPDSFLSVDKTVKLKQEFFNRVKKATEAGKTYWSKSASIELFEQLLKKSITVGYLQVVLFSSVDKYIGAIYVTADSVLRNAMAVWKVVNEDLCLVTEDCQNGLCLEENFYTAQGEYIKDGIYELTVWGIFA